MISIVARNLWAHITGLAHLLIGLLQINGEYLAMELRGLRNNLEEVQKLITDNNGIALCSGNIPEG